MVVEALALLSLTALALTSAAVAGVGLRARTRSFPGRLYRIAAPPATASAEAFFVGVHGLLRSPVERFVLGQPPIALELAAQGGDVHLQLWVADRDRGAVASLLRASYPGVVMVPVLMPDLRQSEISVARVRLREHRALPIRTDFDAEPLAGAVSALAAIDPARRRGGYGLIWPKRVVALTRS